MTKLEELKAARDADLEKTEEQTLDMRKIPDNLFCRCGARSVVFDTWFNYFPCSEHEHLSPVEYSRLPTKPKDKLS